MKSRHGSAWVLIVLPWLVWMQWGYPHWTAAVKLEAEWKDAKHTFEAALIKRSVPVYHTEHGERYHTRRHYRDRHMQTTHFEAVHHLQLTACQVCISGPLKRHGYPPFPDRYPMEEAASGKLRAYGSFMLALLISVIGVFRFRSFLLTKTYQVDMLNA